MAEPVERTSVLVLLRPGQDEALAAALASLGLSLPPPGRFLESEGLLLARLGPHQAIAMRQGADHPLMDELAPLEPHASLIDWSDSRVAVRLSGRGTATRLATLVPIDLEAFEPGHCTQTLAAHLNVLLLQHAPEHYEIQCGRSFLSTFLTAVQHLTSWPA